VTKPSKLKLGDIIVPLEATAELKQVRRRVYAGRYEDPERRAIAAIVRPDDSVLEIGAGVGIVSASIASRLGKNGRLITYEANPNLERSIVAVAEANHFTYRPRIASVGAEKGQIEFYINADTFESSSTHDRGRGSQSLISISQHSLQDVFDEVQPNVLLIDIEGAETNILSWTFPSTLRAICAEFHPHIVGDREVTRLVRNLLNQNFNLLLDQSGERVFAFSR
jgi:FkbM family methyltransferase